MKKLLLSLFFVGLSGCASLPLPRWISSEHFSVYAPFGYFADVDDTGRIDVGMPEITNGVTIERISSTEAFQERAQRTLDLTRSVYPKEWVSITEIAAIGHLKGKGYKVVVNQVKNDPELSEETYLFLVESDGWWLVSAASKSGDKSGWRSILSSLSYKKSPNQAAYINSGLRPSESDL